MIFFSSMVNKNATLWMQRNGCISGEREIRENSIAIRGPSSWSEAFTVVQINFSHNLNMLGMPSATIKCGWCSDLTTGIYTLQEICYCALPVLGACYISCMASRLLDNLSPETFHWAHGIRFLRRWKHRRWTISELLARTMLVGNTGRQEPCGRWKDPHLAFSRTSFVFPY